MTGVYNGIIPCILEIAIRDVVRDQDFPDTCVVNIENLDGENQVLNSAFSVLAHTDDNNDEKCLAMFVKCLEDNKESSFFAESRIFFNNEVIFYGELLQAFKELCVKYPQLMYKAAPICYKSLQDNQISYIIMENLFYYGYQDIDSCKPLQLNVAHLVAQELGKLHGLSFVLKDQEPLRFSNIVDKIEETLFRDDMRSTFGKLFVHAIHDALKLAKHSLPPKSIYIERLSDFTLNVFDRMICLAKGDREDDEYKIVTHGDLRNGNILIRNKDGGGGGTTDICLLDYQACRYASPAHDLSFFLFMCLDKSTRDQHRENIINTYHNTLCSTIEQLGSEPIRIFPKSALTKQLRKNARFALAVALAGLPMYMDEGAEPNEELPVDVEEEILEPDVVLQAARESRERKSMKCKNKMMEIIIDAVDLGWL